MGKFGEELRRERETRGIALEEITAVTKVSARHLAALEREEFQLLPGGVFNKGIVRSYARVVGLDQDDWVSRYLSAYQQSGSVMDDDASWIEFANNVHQARASGRDPAAERLRWIGVFLLLLVLAMAAYFVFEYVKRRETIGLLRASANMYASCAHDKIPMRGAYARATKRTATAPFCGGGIHGSYRLLMKVPPRG